MYASSKTNLLYCVYYTMYIQIRFLTMCVCVGGCVGVHLEVATKDVCMLCVSTKLTF